MAQLSLQEQRSSSFSLHWLVTYPLEIWWECPKLGTPTCVPVGALKQPLTRGFSGIPYGYTNIVQCLLLTSPCSTSLGISVKKPSRCPSSRGTFCVSTFKKWAQLFVCIYIYIHIITGCEFTWSGWDPWFSIRKWMLYKLGTQENLATDIKPIRATLEKWHPPRSAFSKLWTVFFLRKSSPYLNGIMLKIEIKIFEHNFQGMVPFL